MGLLGKADKNSRTNRATRIWPIQRLTLIWIVACSSPVWAQTGLGAVTGRITDASGFFRKRSTFRRGQRVLSKKYIAYSLMGLLACLLSLPAMAQAVRGQVRGLVTDQTGSVLPGAKVNPLEHQHRGCHGTKPSDNAGIYVFDFVEPGTYTVSVEAGGFARHVQQNIVVQSGSHVNRRRYHDSGGFAAIGHGALPLRPSSRPPRAT